MYPPAIQNLIEKFSHFPTIGGRTAVRFVFYVLDASDDEIEKLMQGIRDVRANIHLCQLCFRFAENLTAGLCNICSDALRDKSQLCIVEKESDLETLEKTKLYKGLYFILGGTVGTLKKEEISKIRLKELQERIVNSHDQLKEVIIATNPTLEGESTALYVERLFEPTKIRVTRLARGLPVGGELEYADEETLRSAFEGRK